MAKGLEEQNSHVENKLGARCRTSSVKVGHVRKFEVLSCRPFGNYCVRSVRIVGELVAETFLWKS